MLAASYNKAFLSTFFAGQLDDGDFVWKGYQPVLSCSTLHACMHCPAWRGCPFSQLLLAPSHMRGVSKMSARSILMCLHMQADLHLVVFGVQDVGCDRIGMCSRLLQVKRERSRY